MTKIDIISGFLGAGKTTLIKKLLKEAFAGEKVVLIENEFGEIGIDGGFLKEAGIEITEMNSGCICCSLVGDFGTALKDVLNQFHPERIIIEPSGVGKLSDVIKAVQDVQEECTDIVLNSFVTVADATKVKMYMKNFGEFYNNQIENASTIILSRTGKVKEDKLEMAVKMLQEHNSRASVITTPWDELDGKVIQSAMEKQQSLVKELLEEEVCPECGHHHEKDAHHHGHEETGGHGHHHGQEEVCGCGNHHDQEETCGHGHHHDHEEECECGHDHDQEETCECGHDHDQEETCGQGHHHDHEEGCGCGQGHHHDHEEGCGCGQGHHHDQEEGCGCGQGHHEHGHHHADEVFTSWGVETPHKYTEDTMKAILEALANSEEYGMILRAKGMLPNVNGEWIYFDLVPGEYEIRKGAADYTGRLCVIGADLKTAEIEKLFQL